MFESTLVRNIHDALKKEDIQGTVKREWGRIYLYTEEIKKACTVLQRIFGIVSISPAIQTTSDLNDISKIACNISKPVLGKKTSFAVRATRAGTHVFTSQEVAIRVGNDIVHTTCSPVDLSNPDVEVFIEIRNQKAFVFSEKISGTGGLPRGTQGNVLTIIDSPQSLLAAWFVMRRGCSLHIVLITESTAGLLDSFMKKWYIDSPIIRTDSSSPDFFNNLNTIVAKAECDAIVTETSFNGTKKNIETFAQWKKQCAVPVLYPLLSFDEKELQKKCREVGISQ